MTDEELLKKLIKGEDDTLSHIIDDYSKLLWMVVSSILNNSATREDIEECISDVFVQLWKNPKAFDPTKGSLKNFLVVIAKSKALDAYRKLSKVKIVELDCAIKSKDEDLLDYIINKETSQALFAAIKSLAEPNREIVLRRYFFEEKPAYIAQATSLPVKEVENRLYQSKLKLRKFLEINGGIGHA
ncbi:MAG: sigma-70 family RNA polymerase sigma factor [Defluviitaleaceae bacterium]|nr:sigma-70 family RNA polymerase sigma factor [Defluviitaleaceae bacterium]